VTSFSPGKEATDAAPAAPLASCTVARQRTYHAAPTAGSPVIGGWFLGESKHFSSLHLLDSEAFQGSDL
jgi:hypothetical protein